MKILRFVVLNLILLLLFPVLASAATSINKQFMPATGNPGDISLLTITLYNDDTVHGLTAAALTDNMPSAITISSPVTYTNTCGFTGVSAVAGSSQIILTGGSVPTKVGNVIGQCYFAINVVSTTPGNWINTIPANGPSNGFIVGGNIPGYQALDNSVVITNTTIGTATLAVNTLSPPTGSINFNPATIYAGDTSTLTIVLTNPATNKTTMPLTTFTDGSPSLPTGMKVAPTPAANVNCTGTGAMNGTFAPAAGATTLTMTGGTIGGDSVSGGTCTLTVNVVGTTTLATTPLTNSVATGAIGNTRGLSSVAFSNNLTVKTPIVVTKSFFPTAVGPNQDSILTITISNASVGNPLTITSIKDTLPTTPNPMTVGNITATPATITCTGDGISGTFSPALVQGATSLTMVGATAAASGSCSIKVPVRVISVGTATANTTYTNNIASNTVLNPNSYANLAKTAVLTVYPNMSVTKTSSPTTVAPAVPVTYTIVINNYSSADLTGVTLTDNLPTSTIISGYQMVLANPVNIIASGACSTATGDWASGTVAGSNQFKVTGFTISQGGICTIKFNAIAPQNTPATAKFTNSLPINAICSTNPVACNSLVNSPVVTVNPGGAAITKTFTPTAIVAGSPSDLAVKITNNTGAAISNVSLTDDFALDASPSGLVLTTPPILVSNTCGGSVTQVAGASSVTLSGGSIPASPGNCTFSVKVTSNTANVYNNTIHIAALTTAEGVTNAAVSTTATLNVSASPLSVTKAFANTTGVNMGVSDMLTITLANSSGLAITGVTASDTLPANMVIAPIPGAGTSCVGAAVTAVAGSGTLSVTNAPVPATGCYFRANVIGNKVGNYTNTFQVGAASNGTYSNATTATASMIVKSAATIAVSFTPPNIAQPASSQLTITITNGTTVPLTNASLTDTLTNGLVIAANPNASSNNCGSPVVSAIAGSTNLSISGATVPASGSCTFWASVVNNTATGSFSNQIPIGALSDDQLDTNLAVSAIKSLTVTSGITGSETFTPSAVASGGTSQVSIQINNVSSVPVTGVAITDPLGANLVIATPAGASTTCAGSPTITAVPGATTASLSGATIAAGSNCLFLFNVKTSGTGPWNNSIPSGNITTTEGAKNTSAIPGTLTVGTTTININKSFNPVEVSGGSPTILKIDVTNPVSSASVANNVTFSDTLPEYPNGMRIYPTPNAHTNCVNGIVTATPNGGSITLSGATLPINSTCSVFVNTTSIKYLNLTNIIGAGAVTTTQGYTNQYPTQASLTTLEGVGVAMSFNPTTVSTGQKTTLTVYLVSTMQSLQLTGVGLTDDMTTPGLTIASPSNATTNCTNGTIVANAGSSLLTLSGVTLDASSNCTVQVDVIAPTTTGQYTNTILQNTVTSDQHMSNTQGDSTATLNVVVPPVITNAFDPISVNPGVASTLTVTITNSNAQTLTGANLTDYLLGGLAVSSTPNASTTCAGGAVAAAVAGTSIALTNAVIPVNGNCTFQADVVSQTSGIYPNAIPIGALTTIEGASNIEAANTTLTINAGNPTLTTNANPAIGTVGTPTTFGDSATVMGGFSPTGSITFTLYSDNNCSTTAIMTGSGTISSGGASWFANWTPTAPGTYYWRAIYNGDNNNNGYTTACGGAGQQIAISAANPTVTTTASPNTGTIGTSITAGDTAILVGGYNPTGSITFTLYSDSSCTSAVSGMSGTGTVSNGSASWSNNWTPTAPGTYYWRAVYSGDSNNNAFTTGCNDTGEQIVINKAPPVAINDDATYTPGLPKIVNVLANDTSDNTIVVTSVSIVGGTDSNNDGANEQIIVANEGTWTVNTTTGAITFTPQGEFIGNPTPISYTVKDTLGLTSNAATVTLTATCTANIGSFSGTVWNDVNYNKTLDAGETSLANVPVTLIPQGTTSGTTQIQVTGTDGAFNFASAPAGAYLLQVQDANLNAVWHLYPIDSSLYPTSIATCEHKTKNYGYALTQLPVLGDSIWYDGNANGTQDEWFDANDDGQVTKNDPNVLTNMADWEWIDLNSDNSFTGAANEGELNKCGFGQSTNNNGNVWVTDTATNNLIKKVIIGIQGYWRTRPTYYGVFNVALNLTADGGALSNAAQAMAATGKCKTIVNPRSYLTPTSPIRNKVKGQVMTKATLICAPTGGVAGYDVTLADPGTSNPQPERLDIDFGIECRANQAPIAIDMTNAAPMLLTDGPTTLDALIGTDSDGSVVSITILTIPAAAQGTLFMADGTTAVTVNQVLTVAEAASLKFDPSGTFVGNSTFTFKVTDNNGAISTNTATATVAVVTPPGITVTPTTGLVTTEAGGTDTFTIKLNSQPTANVTIYVSSSDTTEGTVNSGTLTFTTVNWNVAQTVTITGVNDFIADGNVSYLINIASGINGDPNYSRQAYDDVTVTNNDDGDMAGITVTPTTGLITTEAGGTVTFIVKLNSQPMAEVRIDLSSSNENEGTVQLTTRMLAAFPSLIFDDVNWNTPQTVTVIGVDDSIVDGDIVYSIITASAISTDTKYAGLDAADVTVTNTDDDVAAGIIVTPITGLTTTEAGGKATFTVKLASQPIANVMLNLSSCNSTEGNVSPTMLNFTPANWNTMQTVTVTGVDDGVIDNDIPYTIITAAATSADTNYAGLDADDVSITNTNDDILPAPGGVAGYLQLWLATDAGIRTDTNNNVTNNKAVYDWISQSFNKYTAKNSAGNNQTAPLFLNNATDNLNFNPVIKFDGSKNGLDLSSNYIFSTNGTGMTLLAVAKPNATQTAAKTIIDFGNAPKLGIGIGYGNAAMSFYTPTSGGGIDAGNVALTTSTNPVVVTGRATFANKQELFVNGEAIYSKAIPNLAQLTASNISAAATHQTTAGPVTIGRRSNTSSNLFAGIIPEVIIYNTSLSTTELAQVQSYLAIKYGITLNTNYLASDGSTIRAINDGYDYDIAGIGRDDDSDLYQRKSKSSNSGALVTMEISSITADKSFLTWGDNGGAVTYSGIGAPADMDTSLKILGRTWKITNIGNMGAVTFSVSDSVYARSLLIDDDGNFTTDATEIPLTNNTVTHVTLVNVTLADEKYFTLATPEPPAPIAITDCYRSVTNNSVSVLGKVNANGMTTAVKFEYGLTASYGNTQVAAPATVTGNRDTMVQGNLTNLTCATQYHYRVTAANTIGGMANGNDRTFSTSACPLPAVVTAPTAGAVWNLLSNNNVTWSWFTGTKVKIDLYKGGILNRAIAASAANNGIFIWNPPSTQALGSNYFFKVTSITVPSQSAISGVFTIAPPPPPLVVVSPSNTGVVWKRTINNLIVWKDFPGTLVRIYLYKGSSVNNTIANPAPNTGNLNWNVPSTQAVGTNYKIRVQSVSTGGYDESNNYFSIQ